MERTICYTAILTYPTGRTVVEYGTYAEMGEAVMSVEEAGGFGTVLPVVETDD